MKITKNIRNMKNNQGLSLVEMVIAVAIISIVIVTVTSFMVTGTKLFGRSHDEIRKQERAQLAVSAIENRILDAQKGVTCREDADRKVLTIYNLDSSGNPLYEYFVYDIGDQKIYYLSSAGVEIANFSGMDKSEVVAENVTDFKLLQKGESKAAPTGYVSATPDPSVTPIVVATSSANKKQQIEIAIEITDKGGSFTSNKTVAMRNNIYIATTDSGAIFNPGEDYSAVTDVEVSLNSQYLLPGKSYRARAKVKGSGIPSQTVSWKLFDAAGNELDWIDNSGTINVPLNCNLDEVAVQATSVSDDTKVSQKLKATILKVTAISLYATPDGDKQKANSLFQVKAEAVTNISDVSLLTKDLQRAVSQVDYQVLGSSKNDASGCKVLSESGIINLEAGTVGNEYTIHVTSKFNPSVSADYKFTVVEAGISFVSDLEANRNETVDLQEEVLGNNLTNSDLTVLWKLDMTNSDTKLLVDSGKISVASNGMMKIAKDINYEKEYIVKVIADLTSNSGSVSISQPLPVTVKIPVVGVTLNGAGTIKKNAGVVLEYKVTGLKADASDLDVYTNPSMQNSNAYIAEDGVHVSIGNSVKTKQFSVFVQLKGTELYGRTDLTVAN